MKKNYTIVIILIMLLLSTNTFAKAFNIENETIMIEGKAYIPLRIAMEYLPLGSKDGALSVAQDGGVLVLKGSSESLKQIITREGVQYIPTTFLKEAFSIPPTITGITNLKYTYGIGEKIELGYTYQAGSGKTIKKEQWSYYKEGMPQETTFAKPTQLFEPGTYIVKLQVQDDVGSWSNKAELKLRISNTVVESLLHYKFTKGEAGEVIDHLEAVDYLNYKDAQNVTFTEAPGKLIVSNSPERVDGKYLLYQDTVEGKGRLVLHHSNGFTEEENALEDKRLMVIAKNTTEETVNLKVMNKSIKGPQIDILEAGQNALTSYFTSKQQESYTLKPQEVFYIYDSKGKSWKKDEVISGLFDFEADGKVQFTVATGGPDITPETIQTLPVGQKGVHIRGTFDVLDKYYTVDLTQEVEPSKLVIGREKEEWVTGYDALTGEQTYDMGNYGVNIYLKIKVKEEMGILFNPRGGVFRGAVEWNNGQIVSLPKQGYFTHNDKAALVGVLKEGEEKTLTYMLPNGSAAPGLFAFLPKQMWNK